MRRQQQSSRRQYSKLIMAASSLATLVWAVLGPGSCNVTAQVVRMIGAPQSFKHLQTFNLLDLHSMPGGSHSHRHRSFVTSLWVETPTSKKTRTSRQDCSNRSQPAHNTLHASQRNRSRKNTLNIICRIRVCFESRLGGVREPRLTFRSTQHYKWSASWAQLDQAWIFVPREQRAHLASRVPSCSLELGHEGEWCKVQRTSAELCAMHKEIESPAEQGSSYEKRVDSTSS